MTATALEGLWKTFGQAMATWWKAPTIGPDVYIDYDSMDNMLRDG